MGTTPGVLTFSVGVLPSQASVSITYRLRITPAARAGNNINSARITATLPGGNPVVSDAGTAGVRVGLGLFSLQQFIIGRVFEDLNHDGIFEKGERPIAGVRIYLSNGQSATTDSQGLYNIPVVGAGSAVISIDPATVPGTFTLVDDYVVEPDILLPEEQRKSRIRRHDGRSWSRLLRTPLGGGTMLRQNFPLVQDPDFRVVESRPTVPVLANPTSSVALTQRLVVTPASPNAMADGRSSTTIRLLLVDAKGKPVPSGEIRIKTNAGQFVSDQDLTPALGKKTPIPAKGATSTALVESDITSEAILNNGTETLFGTKTKIHLGATVEQVPERMQTTTLRVTNGYALVRLIAPSIPGIARISAETGDPEHRLTAESEIWFSQERRRPIIVALGEIAIGRAAPDFSILGQSGTVSRRADAFLRAPVGKNLVTIAYESHLSLNDTTGTRHMFELDPHDRLYPIYGDSSAQDQITRSNSHLYARVDRGHSYIMYGDLRGDRAQQSHPGINDYSRSLTGIQVHLEDSSHTELSLEGARPDTGFARDVFPGSTFGLIQLSHPTVTPGSELVTVEVRDRYNPELIVSREPLVRSVDYTLDWTTGTIFMLRSFTATDHALNLNQLVVTYDYRTTGLSTTVYSIRAAKEFRSVGLKLGISFMDQRTSQFGSYYLGAVALQQKTPNKGLLKFEMPLSHGSILAAGASSAFGSGLPTTGNGTAIRAEYDQPIKYRQSILKVSAAKTDNSFYNPFGATTLPGSQTIQGNYDFKPLKGARLKLSLMDEKNKTPLVNNGRRTASLEWKQQVFERVILMAGYNYRDFVDTLHSQSMEAHEVTAEIDINVTSKLTASARREQNVMGGDPTYPNQTILAAKYQLSPAVRLFFTQRLSSQPITPIGDLSRSGFTLLGSKNEMSLGVEDRWNKYTSMQGRYLVENGINGTDSFAVIGLVNRIPLSEHFKLDLGVERGTLITGKDGSFNSGSFGLAWLPNKKFKAAARYELRDRGGTGQIFTGGAAGRILEGLTGLAQFQHSNANFTPTSSVASLYNSRQSLVDQGTAALALRPVKSDREAVLFSYTLRTSDLLGLTGFRQKDSVSIISSDAFFQATHALELFGKASLSHRTFSGDGVPAVSTDTYLMQGRAQMKIRGRFDAAGEGRILGQPASSTTRWTAGIEGGYWALRDVRLGVGYSFKSMDEISQNFLTSPIHSGVYFVMSTKLSNIFNLFTTPTEMYVGGVVPKAGR